MKYQCEVIIDLPRERVVALFDDPDNLAKWQQGLLEFEHVAGEYGRPGGQSRLVYEMNGRRVEMKETILERNLPDTFAATYDAKGVHSVVVNHFHEDGPDKTRWVMDNEFAFNGLMRLMNLFMRGAFPKQTLKDMNRFKTFAESA